MGSLVVHYIALLTVFLLLSTESETFNISGSYELKEIRGTCKVSSKCDNCKTVGSISGVKVCCSECRSVGFIVRANAGRSTCHCRGDDLKVLTLVYSTSGACDSKGTWFTWVAIIASSCAAIASGRRS